MKKIIKNILLLFVVIIITLLFLEFMIRFFFPLYVEQSQFNEIYGLENIKNHKSTYCSSVRGEFCTTYKINSKGLRDYEYNYERNEKRRILFLGDSMTVGQGVEMEETFAKVIEKQVQNTEVINGAVRGTSPEDYWLLYKYELSKYDPDVVFVGFFPENDLHISSNVEVSINKKGDVEYKENLPRKQKSKIIQFRMFLAQKSHLYNRIVLGMFNIVPVRNALIKMKLFVPIPTPNCILNVEELDSKIQNTMILFKYFNEQLKKEGKAFALVLIPTNRHIYDDFYLKYKESGCSDDRRYYEYDKIIETCKKYGIKCLDLTPFFIQRNSERIFHKYDGHFNKFGNELVAEVLLKEMESLLKNNKSIT